MFYFIDKYFLKKPKFRRAITYLLEGDKDTDISVLGATMRVNSIKEHGYLRSARLADSSALLRDEIPILLDLAAVFSDGDTFIDVGANVGIYSYTLARLSRIKKDTTFYAFEANPNTFSRLVVHAKEFELKAFNFAVSDHEGMLEFVEGAVSHVFTVTDQASTYSIPSKRINVPCKRLDQVNLRGNSLIIKIDVEGQEKAVLNGASDLFINNRVKAVYLDGYEDREVEKILIQYGFTLFDGRTLLPAQGKVYSLMALKSLNNNQAIAL